MVRAFCALSGSSGTARNRNRLAPNYLGYTEMPTPTTDSSTRLKLTHWFRWQAVGWYERVYQPYGTCTCGRTGWQYRLGDTLICTVCYRTAEEQLIPILKPPRVHRK